MTEEPVATSPPPGPGGREEKRAIPLGIVAGLMFAAVILIGLSLLSRRRESPPPPPTQEDLAYAAQLELSDLRLTAEENFLGQTVVYLDGKMTNRGDKTVRGLNLRLFFRDSMNQVVLRDDHQVVDSRAAPLGPGQAREFQLRFDRLPESWNRQIPQFQLISIQIQ